MQIDYDINTTNYVVIGNGDSLNSFDWERFDDANRVIACNGAWEKIPVQVDMVVASDEHWVVYNRQHCRIPLYTTDVWSTKHTVHSVPGAPNGITTGALGIFLAAAFSPPRIYCLGFDILTLDSTERYHDHAIKMSKIRNPGRFSKDFYTAIEYALPSQTQLLITPEQWRTAVYK